MTKEPKLLEPISATMQDVVFAKAPKPLLTARER